jgi:phosphoglycerate dehydrogenase-like enzyme
MRHMLTVTLGQRELIDALADLVVPGAVAGGLRLVLWDLRGPLPPDVDPADVDAVVVHNYTWTAEALVRLSALPNLRVVQVASAGYENALPFIPPGVLLCNGRGVHDDGTAELALALVLASQRGVDEAARAMPSGTWSPRPRSSLADRRVMVLGYGSVGAAIGRRLDAFAVEVVAVARTRRTDAGRTVHGLDELAALLPTVDVVVVSLPLTQDTDGLVDAAFLAALPDGVLVVNVGRGRVVDTDALVVEVSSGRLRAALDVTEPEPLPPEHPLWRSPGVLITPHVGGFTDATTPRLLALLRRQLVALLQGREPENVVART